MRWHEFDRARYRIGGNYKGPARGDPDPGPNGFEVSAEGDLDGDGVRVIRAAGQQALLPR
jgi:hypothetical protein